MSNYNFFKYHIKGCILKLKGSRKGQSFTELMILVAAGLVVAAFVMVPGLRTFGTTVLTALNTWWTNTVSTRIFPTT